jgi:hypothetical protein
MLRSAIISSIALLVIAPVAHAQLAISWSTIDTGGLSRASTAPFTLGATAGQPDAATLAAGAFKLSAGFWPGTALDCLADTDDGSFSGVPDGGVTIDDLLYYLFIFEQGLLAADLDDGSSTGTPDSGVTIDDLLYFLIRFEAGC